MLAPEVCSYYVSIVGANVRNGKIETMNEQELKEFIARMAELRTANTASPEKARAFLQEEGYLTEGGKVAEPYAKAVGGKS